MSTIRIAMLAGAACFLGACTTTTPSASYVDERLRSMTSGQSWLRGSALDDAIARAAAHPLGSQENPVRAEGPPGQRAYLSRLRCSDGQAPAYERIGNIGDGPYQNFVDAYRVVCAGAQPSQSTIHLDMYHPGHNEARPVPGFTIIGQ
jgi:hypothetical protein